MAKTAPRIPKQILDILPKIGKQIKLARLRRKRTASEVSEEAGISRVTLSQIEQGSPSVSFGAYATVLCVLGLEKDLLLLAGEDKEGRALQDEGLLEKKGRRTR